ncbi:ROK family transcriptional regulator [Vallitalea sediminicola]
MSFDSIVQNRKYNQRNKMLSIIRFHENVSRYDIKKYTSYSMTTVLGMIDELINKGYIYEEECEEARVGRRPVWLRINPKGGYFIGVEFNGRKLHCDMLDFSGNVIYKATTIMNREDDNDIIIDKIVDNINRAREQLDDEQDKVLGVGIGVPGYVDKREGIAKGYTYFKDWENIPIKTIMEKRIGLPCYIDNNVNVMAFAYKWLYFNGDCEDFLFLSIRTGVRMVPVMNSHLIFSTYGFSGEIGHIKVVPSHEICTCGGFGCLNTEVSDFAVASKIREGIRIRRFQEIPNMIDNNLDNITVSTFVDSVRQGHEDSIALMKEVAMYLGIALGFTVNILAPKTIIIYGELAKIGKPFIDEVRKNIEANVIKQNFEGFSIQASKQGEDLGAVGAAALVMQEQFNFINQTI